jgi:hypothetical protein
MAKEPPVEATIIATIAIDAPHFILRFFPDPSV